MPAKPAWLLKIPEIVSMLESFDVPVVDRTIIEHLFDLRRRRAIELLHRLGGFQAGKTFLVDRHVLIENLQRLSEGEEFDRESRRKKRLDGAIDQCRVTREHQPSCIARYAGRCSTDSTAARNRSKSLPATWASS